MFTFIFIVNREELKAQIFYFLAKSHISLHLMYSPQIRVNDAVFIPTLVFVLSRCFV